MKLARFMELYGYDLILALIAIALSFFLGEVLKLGIIALRGLLGLPFGSTALEYAGVSIIPKIAFWIPPVVVTARLVQKNLKNVRRARRTPLNGTRPRSDGIWASPKKTREEEYRVW